MAADIRLTEDTGQSFLCEKCKKNYSSNKNLRQHVKQMHPEVEELPECLKRGRKVKEITSASSFVCEKCQKTYSSNKNLRQHVRQMHPDMELPECLKRGRRLKREASALIKCPYCDLTFTCAGSRRSHVMRKHRDLREASAAAVERAPSARKLKLEKRTLEFYSFSDFQKWKSEEEEATLSLYIKVRRGKQLGARPLIDVYYCHRRGYYRSKGKAVRQLKSQGSCKINGICPASLVVKTELSGRTTVDYYPTHRGHTCDVAYLRISKEKRREIASMLAAGIPFSEVKLLASSQRLAPLSLISKKYLENIVRDFKIPRNVFRRNDDEIVTVPDVASLEEVALTSVDQSDVTEMKVLPQTLFALPVNDQKVDIEIEDHMTAIRSGLLEANDDLKRATCDQLAHVRSFVSTLKIQPALSESQLALTLSQPALSKCQLVLSHCQQPVPQGQIALSQSRVALPNIRPAVPQSRLVLSQSQTAMPQKQLILPQRQVVLPQSQLALPRHSGSTLCEASNKPIATRICIYSTSMSPINIHKVETAVSASTVFSLYKLPNN